MWFRLDLNPEPWTAPEVSVQRRGQKTFAQVYKKAQLRTFQEAVKEQVEALGLEPFIGDVSLEFFFWRQLAEGNTGTSRLRRAHESDATNLQKALEDALQGFLFDNDRQVRDIHSVVVEQGMDVDPKIVIHAEPWELGLLPIPQDLMMTPLSAERPIGQESLF